MYCFFFFNDTATTEIYTLSLHDALPICDEGPIIDLVAGDRVRCLEVPLRIERGDGKPVAARGEVDLGRRRARPGHDEDRKSTRLNSSHANISYAVFCLKKKINDSTLYSQ